MDYLTTQLAAEHLHISQVHLRKLVYGARIPAYSYDDQACIALRQPHERPRQLFFLPADLDAYRQTRRPPGRPDGSKDKKPRRSAYRA